MGSPSGRSPSPSRLQSEEWLPFRSKNLSATTPDQAIKFRMSLPFRTGNSSSLSVAPSTASTPS